MNELVNDGIKLSKLEINNGFINGLPKKWLSLCQSLRNTNHVKDSELASLFGKLKYEENLIYNIYETEKNKSLKSATPLSTVFISTFIVQDFQDSLDDEEDTRSSYEYLNNLEEEYQASALLAKSKRFSKKGTQRFNSTKSTDQIECHKCGKKGHFARDCWSKASVPSYQSPFQPKPLNSSQHKPELRYTKDFEAKYNKVKAKLALLSSSALASKSVTVKNKGLIAEAYEWDEEEVSSDENETVEVKVLMTLTKENDDVSKEGARNVTIPSVERPWLSKAEGFLLLNHDTGRILQAESQRNTSDPLVVVTDSSATEYDSADESSVCSTPLPPLKKLDGVEPIFGPKTIKSILKSKSTLKAKTLKGVKINKPSSAPAKGIKSSSASKVNSAPAGKLKSVKIKDDPLLAIVMKELNATKIKKLQESVHLTTKKIISLERGINPRNPQHAFKRCEACDSSTHTTTDHYDIEWFKRGEELQAKKDEALKLTRAESSNANRSKTPNKSFSKLAFVNGLKYNLIIICQLCDAKYIVQFDEKRGTLFNSDKEIIMIAQRVRDVYILDMTSSAQESCFFAKASENLNWLWHKRLALLNFKTINKLAKQNLVIGLPSLVYSKDKPCSSCEKGKHHRASFKTKQTSSIKKCLHLLHMDLFGPITPRSINHEKYTLVIFDEYSRYTWVYFLKKKSQAPKTIMSFIKRVENQNDIKAKQLRTDNGTEFRNSILVNFCDEKGISQNFSSPYTPKQNGVAERKNRTLIEAARIMLSGLVFSKQYWTEAVATACYTQNRSTIVKRNLKSPYEIFRKIIPNINFLYVFGCPVYIHNNKDHLGKFDEKADDGYLLGYSLKKPITSHLMKALMLSNSQNPQLTTSTLLKMKDIHMRNIFILMSLLKVSSGQNGQTDQNDQSISEHSSSQRVEDTSVQSTISIPNSPLPIPSVVTPALQDKWSQDKHIELVNIIGNPGARMLIRAMSKELSAASTHECIFVDFLSEEEPKKVFEALKHPGWVDAMQDELNQFARNKVWTLVSAPYGKTIIGSKWVFRNRRDETGILQDLKQSIFLAFATYMNFIVYQMDVKSEFLNAELKEEVNVKQPLGFESNEFPNHVCKLDKALYGLKQSPKAWSTSKKLCKQFAKLMTQRYEMSMIAVLTYFLGFQIKQSERGISINQEKYVKDLLKKYDINGSSVKTLMVPLNNLGPDLSGKAVNKTQYRGMIGSLIYLKGTPSLGSWYPKYSGFNLKGYSNSDYARCNMDRKSTSAMSSAEAEYVVVAGCCANILWMKSQLTNYDIIYEKVPIFCDNTSAIAILNNPVPHSRTKHIDIRYHFIRDHILKGDIKLHFIPTQYQLADIFIKPLDEPTFKRLIVELDQIEFTFEEIAFPTNNEVALLYPSNPNSEYFREVLDFSKCCLKEAFIRAPPQYKEYLSEFWYTAKILDESKIWASTPTGGIRGEIDYANLIWEDIIHKLSKKTREKVVPYPRFISLLLEYMMPAYDNEELTINPTQAICNLDVWVDSKVPKPSSQTEEVPQGEKPGAKSRLKRKKISKHTSESKTEASKSKTGQSEKETQSSSAKDKSPSHLSPPTPVVGEMHKEAQQVAGGPTSLGATSEEGSHPQLSSGCDASVDSTAEADPEISAPNDFIPSQQDQTKSARDRLKTAHTNLGTNEESRADDISKKIKLYDLLNLLKDTRFAFFTIDSPQDEPIIVSDESKEEEEVAKDKDTHASSHDKDELEQQKAKAEAEVASLKARPLFPDISQLTNLLVTSLKPELSKLLASHNFASFLPTELKELPSKFTELSGEIKELKQHVKDMEIELHGDLKEIPIKQETSTSTISSLTSQVVELKNIQWELPMEFQALPVLVSSVQKQLKTLDSLLSLLKKVTKTLNRFAIVVENAAGATTKDVPLADQATASPAEGEKNTTKHAETNLQNKLVDLLGIDVVEQYHNKKLLFDKYCDKMLKRRKNSKIINCDVI
ncbi:retrovirus-related pol polyprotein from transposon TNT 1-94 [Tanacetum coccineum]